MTWQRFSSSKAKKKGPATLIAATLSRRHHCKRTLTWLDWPRASITARFDEAWPWRAPLDTAGIGRGRSVYHLPATETAPSHCAPSAPALASQPSSSPRSTTAPSGGKAIWSRSGLTCLRQRRSPGANAKAARHSKPSARRAAAPAVARWTRDARRHRAGSEPPPQCPSGPSTAAPSGRPAQTPITYCHQSRAPKRRYSHRRCPSSARSPHRADQGAPPQIKSMRDTMPRGGAAPDCAQPSHAAPPWDWSDPQSQ